MESERVMYVTVGNTKIFCTIVGAGLPCLVPSLAGTPIYERTFTPALGSKFALGFVELRGNRTAVGDVTVLTLPGLVEEMDMIRQALGWKQTAVIGHSAHSILALTYAAHFPSRTSHVILVGGMPALSTSFHDAIADYWEVAASPERKQMLAANHARLTGGRLDRLSPAQRLAVTYAADGPRYFADLTYDATPLWVGHEQFSPELYQHFWGVGGQFATFDPAASFPRITAPVFIAQGVFDFSAPPIVWVGSTERLARPTYHAFERSGHYPHVEERTSFAAAVTAWLQHD